MHRIDSPNSVPAPDPDPGPGVAGFFSEGDPGIPRAATEVGAFYLNMIQDELENVCLAAGIPLDRAANNQVALAIAALITASIPPVSKGFVLGEFLYTSVSRVSLAPILESKVFVEILGTVYTDAGTIIFDMDTDRHADTPAEPINAFVYAYVHPVAAVLTPKISSTAPVSGYHPVSADHRHVGTFRNGPTQDVVPFTSTRRGQAVEYRFRTRPFAPHLLGTASPPDQNYTSESLAGEVPPTAREVFIMAECDVQDDSVIHYAPSVLSGVDSGSLGGVARIRIESPSRGGQVDFWVEVSNPGAPAVCWGMTDGRDPDQYNELAVGGWRE